MADQRIQTVVGFKVDTGSVNTVKNANRGVRESVEDIDHAYDRMGNSAEVAGRKAAGAANNVSRFSVGGAAEGVDRFGSVSSQILGGLGSGEAANAAGLLGDLGGAISGLSPVGLAATAATVGLTLVLGQAVAATQKVAEETRNRLMVEADVIRFLQTATEEAARERIAQLEEAIAAENRVLLDQAIQRGEYVDYFATYPLEGLRAQLGLAYGEFTELDAAVEQTNQNIADMEAELTDLQEGLEANATAAGELAAALESSETVQREAERLHREVARIIREEQAKALNDLQAASVKVTDASSKAADAQTALTAAQTAYANIRPTLEAAAEEKVLAIQAKANDEAAKIASDYGVTRKRGEEDLARELKRLARSEAEAIQDRSATALDAAKNATADAKEQGKTEARRRDEDYRARIRQLAEATNKQIQLERDGAQKQIQIEQQKQQLEINARQQALTVALQQYNAFLSALTAAFNQYRSLVGASGGQIVVPQSAGILTNQQARDLGFLPQLATGMKRVPYDGYVASLHEGERVLNEVEAERYNRSEGGVSIAINGYGMNKRQVLRMVDKALDTYDRGLRIN